MKTDECKTYLFQYSFAGETWGFELKAASPEEAEARIKRLPMAQYLGELQMKIPARLGLFARLICWWRNRRRKQHPPVICVR